MCFRVRPHVREPGRRRGQRHLPRARAGEPQQPEPPVPVYFPGGCRPTRARRVPHIRSARQTTRVRIMEIRIAPWWKPGRHTARDTMGKYFNLVRPNGLLTDKVIQTQLNCLYVVCY